ncbi:MAG: Cys-tRNA(Pro) deacylase [Spirochaetales bacterium]
MPDKTNAVRLLENSGATFVLHEYEVDPNNLDAKSVAGAVGFEAERVFKTLVTETDDGEHAVFCIPGTASLNLKKAALAISAKRVRLLPLKQLEPLTGYIHGGCSPIGMKRALPTVIDESATLFETILVSGGRRGLQVEISSGFLAEMIRAPYADVAD